MEKFCIYLKETEPKLTFKSGEHIFPAGIGGIQKLPMEYVSHDANNAFSAMEGQAMKKSLLAIPRQLFGPGKRGNISNPKKATKSSVSLMNELDNIDEVKFGYVALGKPYFISQIKVNGNGSIKFTLDQSFGDVGLQTGNFIDKLQEYNGEHILYEDERFNKDEFLLGFHEERWYLGVSDKKIELKVSDIVNNLVKQNPLHNITPQYNTAHVTVDQLLEFDESYFRVCAKIIFNYLAFAKGRDFVLQDCFNPIRNWILNGGENTFANLAGENTNFGANSFPDQAHKLFIIQIHKKLVGHITFYGNEFTTVVKLCDEFEGFFDIEGFICDWKNKKEYKFIEYLNSRVER